MFWHPWYEMELKVTCVSGYSSVFQRCGSKKKERERRTRGWKISDFYPTYWVERHGSFFSLQPFNSQFAKTDTERRKKERGREIWKSQVKRGTRWKRRPLLLFHAGRLKYKRDREEAGHITKGRKERVIFFFFISFIWTTICYERQQQKERRKKLDWPCSTVHTRTVHAAAIL